MKGKLLAIFSLVALLGAALSLPAMADGSVPISATVSAKSISVTVDPTSIDYGALAFEESRSSTALGITFTATNDGNVNENFAVEGANATGTGPAFTWTIQEGAPSCESPGQTNLYRHSVTPAGGSLILLTTDQQDLALGVAPSGTKSFTSEFWMPCNGSAGTGQTASTTITVVAIEAGS
jgi:hypothetical protein